MNYGGYFEPEKKQKRIQELENKMEGSNFWNNKRESEKVITELNQLKKQIEEFSNLKKQIENNIEMLSSLKENTDLEMLSLLEEENKKISEELENLQIELLLNGPYDKMNAIVEIHSGAGGTEAQDWANMLYRMYDRYFHKKGYKIEVVDIQPCDDAGIKSVTMIVKGENIFGHLKGEKGVHRLIRISPFDSGARRHTSFASVDVTPLFDNSVNIEINPNDLRIDVYRSSGCGGQGVNTTDSAVRITHLPTKIVVTCQNERSQIQNKERAMEVLKNKLYQLELEKKENELKGIKGENMDVNFGSQIRTYVMHPYFMVKDHRTNVETSNVEKVLDGDLDLFVTSYLKRGEK
ncbi:MAG: peptide chain release factor 2 [Tenericutes bacterium]|nr:peptide chain release factor 2 [Mycoplasmatota bacterium]